MSRWVSRWSRIWLGIRKGNRDTVYEIFVAVVRADWLIRCMVLADVFRNEGAEIGLGMTETRLELQN